MIPMGGMTEEGTEEGSDGLPLVDKRLGFQLAALPNSMMIMLCLELGSPARQAQFAVNASQICVSSIDGSMSEHFESKLKEKSKSGLSSTMRKTLLEAYSKDKGSLRRMTSRHVEEETKGCDLASFLEATELGEEDLAHVDSIFENTKPSSMVDIEEDDEGDMKRERMMSMLKTFDLSSEWETQVRSRYEMDHWFAKAGSVPKKVDDKVELEEVLAQDRVPADSNLLSFQGASAMNMLQRIVQQAVMNRLVDCED